MQNSPYLDIFSPFSAWPWSLGLRGAGIGSLQICTRISILHLLHGLGVSGALGGPGIGSLQICTLISILHLPHGAGVCLALGGAGTGSLPICTVMPILPGPGVFLALRSTGTWSFLICAVMRYRDGHVRMSGGATDFYFASILMTKWSWQVYTTYMR